MKILYINTTYLQGGAARIARSLAQEVQRHGHEVLFLYGRGISDGSVPSIRIETTAESAYYALNCRIFDNDGLCAVVPTKRIIRKIEEFNPDLVHIHNMHGYYLEVRKLFDYLHKRRIPVVWTLHDFWGVTGHCVHFLEAKCECWKYGTCKACPEKGSYPASKLLDASGRNFKIKKQVFNKIKNIAYVTPSKWMKQVLSGSFLDSDKIHAIPNGIYLGEVTVNDFDLRSMYGLTEKKIILGVANGWEKGKGLDVFLNLSKHIDANYHIVLVGFKDNVPEDLPSNVLGLKRTESFSKLAAWYETADVFLNASKQETFGLVSVEAMAYGTPVVAFDVCANREIIINETGKVIESEKELVDAIESICNEDANTYADSCRRQASLFSVERMTNDYLDLYSRLLGKGRDYN